MIGDGLELLLWHGKQALEALDLLGQILGQISARPYYALDFIQPLKKHCCTITT